MSAVDATQTGVADPCTVRLRGGGTGNDVVGGKGSALDRLITHGFPVPPTGAVTTAGYRRFIATSGLGDFIDELRRSPIPEPAAAAAETQRVDDAFLDAPMDPGLQAEILALAHEIRGRGRLAVRSSATAEDTDAASFAGQYDSFLELESDAEVLRAVRLVWASLWHPAPRSYRDFRGIDDADISMAVIVMRLVEASHAGVAFTVDPGGAADQMRIETVEGLGEQLVSGSVTPDAVVVGRNPAARRFPAHLQFLAEVADLALEIEAAFGGPQDVEWVFDSRKLWVVQARPITAGSDHAHRDEFDTSPGPDATWTTAGIAEMVPGVLAPLDWTINGPALEHGFRQLFADLVDLPPGLSEPQALIGRFRGRAALNLTLLQRVASGLPGASAAEIERQYFGRTISDHEPDEASRTRFTRLRTALQGIRETRVRRRLAVESDVVIAAVDRIIGEHVDIAGMSDPALLAYRHRLVDLGWRVIAAEVAVAAAAAAAYRGLEVRLETHVGREAAASYVQQLTTGGLDHAGGQTALDVCDLVAIALAVPEVGAAFDEPDLDATRAALHATEAGEDFYRRFEHLLERAGSASVFAGATWRENEDLAWRVLAQAVDLERHGHPIRSDTDRRAETLSQVERHMRSSWTYTLKRVLTGQLVDMRKRMLRQVVADTADFLNRREQTKAAVLRLGGEVRRVHLELGQRLAERGAVAAPQDVFLLASAEVDAAMRGAGPTRQVLHRRARHLEAARTAAPLPLRFTGFPDAAAAEVGEDGTAFTGWAASAGSYTGRARVLDTPGDELERGDVLVARTTDPSWTPLFLTAGAIVVEEGGPLSHAAIVARELGIPAVLNVPGIVERLRDGDHHVHVNGSVGVVRILDAEAVAADAVPAGDPS